MKNLLGVLLATVIGASLVSAAPARAGSAPATTGPAATATAATRLAAKAPAPSFSMRDRFAREIVRRGQSDQGTSHIAHVRELQYRLRWAGVYRAGITGTFGDLTRAAVIRYQRREGLWAFGVANHMTW